LENRKPQKDFSLGVFTDKEAIIPNTPGSRMGFVAKDQPLGAGLLFAPLFSKALVSQVLLWLLSGIILAWGSSPLLGLDLKMKNPRMVPLGTIRVQAL
jgi:hypothetical protein